LEVALNELSDECAEQARARGLGALLDSLQNDAMDLWGTREENISLPEWQAIEKVLLGK